MRSRRGGLDVAKGSRSGPGISLPVYGFLEGAGPDFAHSWGIVPGPVVVEHLLLSTTGGGVDNRTAIMVWPAHIGHVEGADLSSFLLSGIQLMPEAGVLAGAAGWPSLADGSVAYEFWPRKLIPWARWVPGFVMLGTTGAAATVVIFSVRFLER